MMLPDVLPAGLPWWAGAGALLALTATAIVDARTGRVPPWPIYAGVLLVIVGWLVAVPPLAAPMILAGFFTYCAIWAINMIWALIAKQDALGMGDANWSLLAALSYGWALTSAAWGAGAFLAILYLAIRRALKRPAAHVYFAPFLCVGLIAARIVLG